MASRAVELDPDAPLALRRPRGAAGGDRQYEEAIASARRAVALGPSDARCLCRAGARPHLRGRARRMRSAAVDRSLAPRSRAPRPATRSSPASPTRSTGATSARSRCWSEARAAAPLVEDVNRCARRSPTHAPGGWTTPARRSAEALRLGPSSMSSCSASIFAHFRDERDLAAVLDAMRQAGLPEWPFGFRGDGLERLNGAEISRLALGRTWQGRTETGEPAFFQIGADGRSAFRTPSQIETGTVFVDSGHALRPERERAVWAGPGAGRSTAEASTGGDQRLHLRQRSQGAPLLAGAVAHAYRPGGPHQLYGCCFSSAFTAGQLASALAISSSDFASNSAA